MIAWFKRMFGRGSKVDLLIRALPNPDRIRYGLTVWAETLREFGDRGQRWEASESTLVEMIRTVADAADWIGPMVGDDIIGDDKRAALIAKLRYAATAMGLADEAFDAFWLTTGRPILDRYIERLRA